MRYRVVSFLALSLMTIHAGQPEMVNLGSGHRGLIFKQVGVFDSRVPPRTVILGCNLSPGYFIESGLVEGDPDSQIILKETLKPEYAESFGARWWSGWTSLGLFSFDVDAAFDGSNLYRIEKGHIRIYPKAALQEARKRYQLEENQIFLGAFEGRAFYWVKDHPREAYFRMANHTYRFKLPKRITEPLGMAKGDPDGDLALYAVGMPKGWLSTTPRTLGWTVLNVRDAERIP